MAKTIEEIINEMELTLNDDRDSQKAVISEIYCGFNQPESKIAFSGLIKDIPEELKNTRYTQACFDPKTNTHQIEYTNHVSFEGKKLFQQLQIQKLK